MREGRLSIGPLVLSFLMMAGGKVLSNCLMACFPMEMEEKTWFPFVSIVVLTLNSEKTIKKCLDAIFQQGYPKEKYEVIVIDNGSVDATAENVKKYEIKSYEKSNANIPQLRNFGAKKAKGEILWFVDSDCQVESDCVQRALSHLVKSDVGVVGGRDNYDLPDDPHWIEKAWNSSYTDKPRRATFVPAGNMFIRKEIFAAIQGFNEDLETGEDTDLCARIRIRNYQVISDPNLRSIHWGNPKTLLAFVRKQIWHGQGMVRLIRERDFSNKVILLTFSFVLAHVALFSSAFVPLETKNRIAMAILSSSAIFSICSASAFYRCLKLKCYRHILQLLILWYLYFVGRSLSIMALLLDFLKSSRY